MDLNLGKRTCVVTGASAGIGRATAVALAAEGAHLVVAARSLDGLRTLVSEIMAATGREPVALTADLAIDGAAKILANESVAKAGRVDVLVNCAGGSRPLDEEASEATWAEAFQLNFISARLLAEHLAPAMRGRRWGRIINVTGAIVGKTRNAAAPAKAALESWAKAAAATYAADGVTVNCVAPGRINSEQILGRLHPTEESRRAFIKDNIPAGRFGDPQEAAALIAFLASGSASYVTGTTIPVDGGAMRLAF